MRQVVLYLTWGLILILIVRDHRNSPKNLPGLWLSQIWILILASRDPSYWFGSDPEQANSSIEIYEQGNAFNRYFYLVLIVLGIVILLRRRIDWGNIAQRNWALTVFACYSLISILWSDYPMVAFKGYFKAIVGNIVMALIVLTDPDASAAINSLLRRCAFVLLPLSVIFIKFFPAIGRAYNTRGIPTYGGVTSDGNALSTTCYVCGIILVWNLIRKGATADRLGFYTSIVMLLMSIWLTLMGDGGTAQVSCMIGVGILIMLRLNRFSAQIYSVGRHIGVFLVVAVPILVFNYAWFLNTVSSIFGHSTTLWDRYDLWTNILSVAVNPILGAGFGTFWLGPRLAALWKIYWWRPTESHNGYVEIYLQLGYLGLALFAGVVVSACRKSTLLELKPELQWLKLAYLLPLLFYNLTEAGFRGLHLVWFTFLLFAIETQSQMQDKSQSSVTKLVSQHIGGIRRHRPIRASARA